MAPALARTTVSTERGARLINPGLPQPFELCNGLHSPVIGQRSQQAFQLDRESHRGHRIAPQFTETVAVLANPLAKLRDEHVKHTACIGRLAPQDRDKLPPDLAEETFRGIIVSGGGQRTVCNSAP